jgi:hypothetical protein
MTWVKRVGHDEKLELKLTDAERKLLLDHPSSLPAKAKKALKAAAQTVPTMLTLRSLDDLSKALAIAWKCCEDMKSQRRLESTIGKVHRLLDAHVDKGEVLITKDQARKKTQAAMLHLLEGKEPGIISFKLKPTKQADQTYPLKLTRHQRESLIHCTRLKRSLKNKLEGVAGGSQLVLLTRKELDLMDDEVGEAVVYAPSTHEKHLIAVLDKIASFSEEDHQGHAPRPRKRAPDKYSDLLFQFRVTLLDVHPPVWRRFQVRDCTLAFLHNVIQVVMGWENYHLHQFVIAGERYGPPAPDEFDFGPKTKDENRLLLSSLLPKTAKRIRWIYDYDFGDGWRHEVLFEGYPALDKEQKYPLCLEGERACPPEDCGGPWGYADFLDAIKKSRHEQHEDMLKWIGEDFDPDEFDVRKVNAEVKRYLRVSRGRAGGVG